MIKNSAAGIRVLTQHGRWWHRKINSSGVPGARLRRGYLPPANPAAAAEVDAKAEEADEYAGTTPISHLVFAIHGIGQNLSGSNIAGKLSRLVGWVVCFVWPVSAQGVLALFVGPCVGKCMPLFGPFKFQVFLNFVGRS
jgi:hypothetical protein